MALTRAAAASVLRASVCAQCRRTVTTQSPLRVARRAQTQLQPGLRLTGLAVRHHSAPASNAKQYDFNQVKAFSESPSAKRILIDVREPAEYEQGFIPSARNMPIKSQPDALFLPEDEFEERFGFEKPGKDQEVVFYCRAGVRSSAAAQLAQQNGYENVSEYRGSWLDWVKNGGEGPKA